MQMSALQKYKSALWILLMLLSLSEGWTPSALDLEQNAAQARRAEVERTLMLKDGNPPPELSEATFSLKEKKKGGSGGGFGGAKQWNKGKALAKLQKKRLEKDGVLRINQVLSPEACDALRTHVVSQVKDTFSKYQAWRDDPERHSFVSEDYYGIEPTRTCRTDLLLSLQPPPVSNALKELFDKKTGKLRALYESLVTREGTMYELASVVTSPGSDRQCIHPDLPFQSPAPLYVVFLALQDVTTTMGPTTFLKGTNTRKAQDSFYSDTKEPLDELIGKVDIVESTMKKGDCVVFDALTLHCGNANVDETTDRALFNFSFRNPKIKGPLGYKGSMRPEYTKQLITLGDVLDIVDEKSDKAFCKYGDGLPQEK